MKILITGASGFVGSFLVEHGLEHGHEVWAALRATSSRRYLTDPRIRFIELNLGDDAELRRQLSAHGAEHGAFDCVIHAAGATKAANLDAFRRTNTAGTLRLARTLLELNLLRGRFVFVSSLSVMGPAADPDSAAAAAAPYRPISDSDRPVPNTDYGRSKLEAEEALAGVEGLDYVILRPTGVYGPRERDYFLMADSIRKHIDFAVGYRPQRLTFIYVRDLVDACYAALTRGERGRAYFLSDGGSYDSREFGRLGQRLLPPLRPQGHNAPDAQPRQVPPAAPAQLVVRHRTRPPRSGFRPAVDTRRRCERSRRLVQKRRLALSRRPIRICRSNASRFTRLRSAGRFLLHAPPRACRHAVPSAASHLALGSPPLAIVDNRRAPFP